MTTQLRNKTLLGSLIAAASLCAATPVVAMSFMPSDAPTTSEQADRAIPGMIADDKVVLVILREGINDTTKREILTVTSDEADAKKAELLSDPDVISVEEAREVFTPPLRQPKEPDADNNTVQSQSVRASSASNAEQNTPLYNDSLYGKQTHFDPTQEHNLRLELALRRLDFSRTIRVGIVDGGFESSVDMTYAEGANLRDVNGNPRGGLYLNEDIDCSYMGDLPISQHGHYVSHMVGALANNALGMAGTTVNVDMVAARAMNCGGGGLDSDITDGILWLSNEPVSGLSAISAPVDVINLSLGGEGACPNFYQTAINTALSKGIHVIVAAGNDRVNTDNIYPANCEGVITIAATNKEGNLANFTNTGAEVDAVAEGNAVTAITPNGNEATVSGTSFATPIVAGVIANILSERPNLTPAQVEAMVAQAGKPIVATAFDQNFGIGSGILDAQKLLDAAGIPREILAAQSALDGNREQFQAALVHPAAQAIINTETGNDVCALVEVDSRVMKNASASDPFAVFSVPAGQPLNPVASDATTLKQTQGTRILLSEAELNDTSREYGLARCDLNTGSNCNQIDTIRGFNPQDLQRPAICETTVASASL